MNIFRKKNKEKINYLGLTPKSVHNHKIESDGLVTVLVPRFTSKFWGKYLLPKMKNKYINLKLDEIGSATWLMLDGSKRVDRICSDLNEKFGEKIHPVEERVTKFLTQLYLNKFINFNEFKNKEK
ncbi:MAG: PqqD family protein [Bacteroidales bacterium]|nr:PqqD family protein [Bacteroidales bacterium]